ncbi:SPOR domain-containing protein [Methylovulum psychrotolerans]|uniref:SPOR domain-containing protein n=1 Tax=Methylovulum psychrotolerans TaxID=1704499 RepID=UPI001BFFAA51|nr:SPOR domain-containing protein [Methylovulum psychrotolerans]MBT9096278.1 SPOR domain-containing protein [Methylovulum psychrotolerans]
MAKDYKHRGTIKKKSPSSKRVITRWQGLLVGALVFAFIAFLAYLKLTSPKEPPPSYVAGNNTAAGTGTKATATDPKKGTAAAAPEATETKEPPKPKPPHFEFYTVLPDKEVVVPDYELKTRVREERIGKAKDAKYVMQVGSFQTFKEADQLRAKLALMGIASKVDKAKIDGVTTHRVKLGPFTQMKSVNDIRLRLKTMGANVIVTEMAPTKPVVQTPQRRSQ